MNIQKFFHFFLVMICSLTMSFFVFLFVAGLSLLVFSLMSWKEFEILFLLAPATASITWLSTTNVLIKTNKNNTIRYSYFIGCLVTVFICYVLNIDVDKTNWETFISIFLSAAIPGFLICIKIQKERKEENKKQNIFNTLDENI